MFVEKRVWVLNFTFREEGFGKRGLLIRVWLFDELFSLRFLVMRF